jgi:hypothetical protein
MFMWKQTRLPFVFSEPFICIYHLVKQFACQPRYIWCIRRLYHPYSLAPIELLYFKPLSQLPSLCTADHLDPVPPCCAWQSNFMAIEALACCSTSTQWEKIPHLHPLSHSPSLVLQNPPTPHIEPVAALPFLACTGGVDKPLRLPPSSPPSPLPNTTPDPAFGYPILPPSSPPLSPNPTC